MKLSRQVLEGVKVVDFGWIHVDPATTSYLADYGATVVRVESSVRLDHQRITNPYKFGKADTDQAIQFHENHRNKLGMTLNLNHPKGIEIAKRLVAWADVVTEGYTPGRMKQWGLGYEELRKVNPDLIMMSTSSMGQTGPASKVGVWGHQLGPWTGFTNLNGWPDRDPPTDIAYTDYLTPEVAAACLLAALASRHRTGKGMLLDLAQYEVGIQFLLPVVLDYMVNKRLTQRKGNRSDRACPHGAYRCSGQDRWCVIVISNDQEWASFARAMGNPGWARDARFSTFLGRKQNEDELDRLVESYTYKYSPEEVMQVMQQAGVIAAKVSTGEDIFNDPQLGARGHFWKGHDADAGDYVYNGRPCILSKTPAALRSHPPRLGEHTLQICSELLGMSDQEYLSLSQEGVFT